MSYWSSYNHWAPRKTAGERRADAARKISDAARQGRRMSPVVIVGRKIATTFWGKAWCDNLERYQDYAYRLDRGRSYVRSGSVIDLQIAAGKVVAKVMGSSLYEVAIEIGAVKRDAWHAIQRDCAGSIGSRLDLLSGRLSEPVMARLCVEQRGLFPAPAAIKLTCSCPDYAVMCKHVAATMYGIGARLDHAPELLFTLRQVSLDELLASAITELPPAASPARVLAANGLAQLFGIELAEPAAKPAPGRPRSAATRSAAAPAALQATALARRSAPGKPAPSPSKAPPASKQTPAKKTAASKRSAPASSRATASNPAPAKKTSPSEAPMRTAGEPATRKAATSSGRRTARATVHMPDQRLPSGRTARDLLGRSKNQAIKAAPSKKRAARRSASRR